MSRGMDVVGGVVVGCQITTKSDCHRGFKVGKLIVWPTRDFGNT